MAPQKRVVTNRFCQTTKSAVEFGCLKHSGVTAYVDDEIIAGLLLSMEAKARELQSVTSLSRPLILGHHEIAQVADICDLFDIPNLFDQSCRLICA